MADPGSLLFQGLSNAGAGIGSGFTNYMQMKQQDAAAQGQVDAFLAQAQQTPGVYQSLSQDGQNLLQKQLAGNANRQDRIKLIGEVSTAQELAKNRLSQQMGQQQLQQGQMQNQMMGQRMQYLQGMMGPAQGGQAPAAQQAPAQPQGQPAMASPPPAGAQAMFTNIIQPPKPLTIGSDQAQQLMHQALRMTMGDPEKASDLVQKQLDAVNTNAQTAYNQQVAVKKDTGRLVFMGPKYENGVPTLDNYANEQVTAPGTPSQAYAVGDKTTSFKHGVKPPSPVVFQPGQNLPTGSGAADDTAATIANVSPNNPNDPEWQKELQTAKANAAASASTGADAALLLKAAKTYTGSGTSAYNALRGDPNYAKYASLFTGTNQLGNMQTALSANTRAILAQTQSPTGGTIGGRMLQAEYQKASEMLGSPEMDNPTILAAAKNNLTLAQRKYDIDNAYATYRETMAPGEAESLATKQFGSPPELINAGDVYKIPVSAQAFLRAHANNTAIVKQFEDKYGKGMADLAMVATLK